MEKELKVLAEMKKEFVEKFLKETRRMKNLTFSSLARQSLLLYASNIMEYYECFMQELQTLFKKD